MSVRQTAVMMWWWWRQAASPGVKEKRQKLMLNAADIKWGMLHLACLDEETATSGCCGIAETNWLTLPKTKGNIRKHSMMTPKNKGKP